MILAMIRNLPEGCRYYAARAADADFGIGMEGMEDLEPEPLDPRMEAVMDYRTWTLDRRLKAIEINTLYALISVTGTWKDGKAPDFPTVGPSSWREENETKSNVPKDNFDVLRKMGWPGG